MKSKIKTLAAIAAFFISIGFGVAIEHWRMDAKLTAFKLKASEAESSANEAARKLEQQRQSAADKQAKAIADALANAEPITKTITKKVTEYVESPDTGKCELNGDWLRAHNTAATYTMPSDTEAATAANAARRTITDREALKVVTENYAICQDRLIKLEGWQNWYKKVIDEN